MSLSAYSENEENDDEKSDVDEIIGAVKGGGTTEEDGKPDLSSHSSHIRTSEIDPPVIPGCCQNWFRAISLHVTILFVGFSCALIGQILPDLRLQTSTSLAGVVWIFICRGFGYIIGSTHNICFNTKTRYFVFLSIAMALFVICMAMIPLCLSLVQLSLVVLGQGIAIGVVHSGCDGMPRTTVRGKNGILKYSHFSSRTTLRVAFAIGAVAAALLVAPYVATNQPSPVFLEATAPINSSVSVYGLTAKLKQSVRSAHKRLDADFRSIADVDERSQVEDKNGHDKKRRRRSFGSTSTYEVLSTSSEFRLSSPTITTTTTTAPIGALNTVDIHTAGVNEVHNVGGMIISSTAIVPIVINNGVNASAANKRSENKTISVNSRVMTEELQLSSTPSPQAAPNIENPTKDLNVTNASSTLTTTTTLLLTSQRATTPKPKKPSFADGKHLDPDGADAKHVSGELRKSAKAGEQVPGPVLKTMTTVKIESISPIRPTSMELEANHTLTNSTGLNAGSFNSNISGFNKNDSQVPISAMRSVSTSSTLVDDTSTENIALTGQPIFTTKADMLPVNVPAGSANFKLNSTSEQPTKSSVTVVFDVGQGTLKPVVTVVDTTDNNPIMLENNSQAVMHSRTMENISSLHTTSHSVLVLDTIKTAPTSSIIGAATKPVTSSTVSYTLQSSAVTDSAPTLTVRPTVTHTPTIPPKTAMAPTQSTSPVTTSTPRVTSAATAPNFSNMKHSTDYLGADLLSTVSPFTSEKIDSGKVAKNVHNSRSRLLLTSILPWLHDNITVTTVATNTSTSSFHSISPPSFTTSSKPSTNMVEDLSQLSGSGNTQDLTGRRMSHGLRYVCWGIAGLSCVVSFILAIYWCVFEWHAKPSTVKSTHLHMLSAKVSPIKSFHDDDVTSFNSDESIAMPRLACNLQAGSSFLDLANDFVTTLSNFLFCGIETIFAGLVTSYVALCHLQAPTSMGSSEGVYVCGAFWTTYAVGLLFSAVCQEVGLQSCRLKLLQTVSCVAATLLVVASEVMIPVSGSVDEKRTMMGVIGKHTTRTWWGSYLPSQISIIWYLTFTSGFALSLLNVHHDSTVQKSSPVSFQFEGIPCKKRTSSLNSESHRAAKQQEQHPSFRSICMLIVNTIKYGVAEMIFPTLTVAAMSALGPDWFLHMLAMMTAVCVINSLVSRLFSALKCCSSRGARYTRLSRGIKSHLETLADDIESCETETEGNEDIVLLLPPELSNEDGESSAFRQPIVRKSTVPCVKSATNSRSDDAGKGLFAAGSMDNVNKFVKLPPEGLSEWERGTNVELLKPNPIRGAVVGHRTIKRTNGNRKAD